MNLPAAIGVVILGTAVVAALAAAAVRLHTRRALRRAQELRERAVRWETFRRARTHRQASLLELVQHHLKDDDLRWELCREAHGRHRLHVLETMHAGVIDSVSALASRLDPPAEQTPAAEVRIAALMLVSQERAIVELSKSIDSMWPVARASRDDTYDHIASSTRSMLETLERNSLKMAATEQVFLNLLSPAQPDPAALSLALHQLSGTLPAALHAAGSDLIHFAQSAAFTESSYQAAGSLMTSLISHTIKGLPLITEAGHLSFQVAAEIAAPMWVDVGTELAKISYEAVRSPEFADIAIHAAPVLGGLEQLAVAEGITAHVPFITVLISMSRELDLLSNKSTTVRSAAKNFTLDVAGTTVGAALGGWVGGGLGAAIGTAMAPGAGTAVGAKVGVGIGAAIGAATSRLSTNRFKRRQFNKANERYNVIVAAAPDRLRARHVDFCISATERVMLAATTTRRDLGSAPALNARHENEWRVIATNFRDAARHDLNHALNVVNIASDWTVSDSQLTAKLASITPALEQAKVVLRMSEERIDAQDYGTGVSMVAVWPLQAPAEFCGTNAAVLTDLVSARTLEASMWSKEASAKYVTQTHLLAESLSKDYKTYQRDHEGILAEVKQAEDAVIAERHKLGLKD